MTWLNDIYQTDAAFERHLSGLSGDRPLVALLLDLPNFSGGSDSKR